jgi:exopolysaccharide biosynthesis polyprenyl glycosylphosphotransferase
MGRYHYSDSGWMVFDAVCMAFWLVTGALIVSDAGLISFGEFLLMRVSIGNMFMLCLMILLWHVIFSTMRVYGQTSLANACSYPTSEIANIVKASCLGTLAVLPVAVFGHANIVEPLFILVFLIGVTASSVFGRFIYKTLKNRLGIGSGNLRKLLLIGVNSRSVKLATQVQANYQFGYQVAGFVDQTAEHLPSFHDTGFRLVSGIHNLPDYLRKNAIDEVVVCLPVRSRYDEIKRIGVLCEEQGITVGMLPDLFPFNRFFSGFHQFGDQTVMTVRPHGITGPQATTKRLLDIFGSAAMLVLLLPVFLTIIVLIKLTSPGPVFFRQVRLGLNKKRFTMLKFRSMVADAEERLAEVEILNEAQGPVFKIKDDPRITAFGRFLRKSSLDELPQLINVLRGEMSLVGPRPLTVRDYEGFNEDWQRRRFSIRPGMTGLWQVSGRCDLPFEQWMKLDMQYIDHWSLSMDFKVLLLTVPAVLTGAGAQ